MLKQLVTGFVPLFEQKIQGLFKHFHGHTCHFSRTPFSAKKSLGSTCMSFLLLPQHEQYYPEVLAVLDKGSTEIQDFPAPTAIFKDFQGLEFLF